MPWVRPLLLLATDLLVFSTGDHQEGEKGCFGFSHGAVGVGFLRDQVPENFYGYTLGGVNLLTHAWFWSGMELGKVAKLRCVCFPDTSQTSVTVGEESNWPSGDPGMPFRDALGWCWGQNGYGSELNKPPGIGPQVLVLGSIYQGSILGTYF